MTNGEREKKMHIYVDAFLTDEGDPDTIELEGATEDDMYHAARDLIERHIDKEYVVSFIQIWEYDNEYDEPMYQFSVEDIWDYFNRAPSGCKSIW